jgi:cardiolipin synthase
MPIERDIWLTFPNALSFLRALLGLFFWVFPREWWVAIIILAGLTDLFDGSLGRFSQTTSAFGRILDPIADKLFVVAVLLTMMWHGLFSITELLLIGLRDLAVLVRALYYLARVGWKRSPASYPSWLGKLTTGLQFLAILMAAHSGSLPKELLITTAIVSGIAGFHYLVRPMPASPNGSGTGEITT